MTDKFKYSLRNALSRHAKRDRKKEYEVIKALNHRYVLAKVLTELDKSGLVRLNDVGKNIFISLHTNPDITPFERTILLDIADFCIGKKKFPIN